VDPTKFVLDISDLFLKILAIFLRKPYATVRVQYAPQKDRDGNVTKELMAFTIINESVREMNIQRAWFLTAYNRIVPSAFLDAKMPVKVVRREKTTFFFPIEEVKAALNKNVQDTIAEGVVMDDSGHKFSGRADKKAQAELSRY
jgi:hypothetical protein